MCCGKETYEKVKEGQVGLTRRKVLKAMGVGTGLLTLGGLTGCTQLLGLDRDVTRRGVNGVVSTAASSDGLVFGDRQAVLLVGDEKITAKAVSWQDRMQGLDLVYESGNGNVQSRIYTGTGEVYVYHRSEDDLITIHSQVKQERLQQLREALEAIGFNQSDFFDLLNPRTKEQTEKRIMENFKRVKEKHSESFKTHHLDLDWNGLGVGVTPLVYSNPTGAAKQISSRLKKAHGRAIWTRGQRTTELVGTNKEFFHEMVALYPGAVSSQNHDSSACSGCGTGAAVTTYRGWWLAGCLVPGYQVMCISAIVATAIGVGLTSLACSRCYHSGTTPSSDPPPPPPSGCSPGPCPEP
jgi:hypothetical protein